MIAHLRGRSSRSTRIALIVDVGGVGYDVLGAALHVLQPSASRAREIALRIHTHVREDQLALYGFATDARAASCSSG